MVQDLLLNLIAEVIGIIATVFIVDRLIQRREEKRWLPSKHHAYAKLLETIGNLLNDTLPQEVKKPSSEMYMYGNVGAFPKIELGLDEPMSPTLLPSIEQGIELHKQFDTEIVSRARQEIEDILDQRAFLLDPELLTLVLELDRRLTSLVQINVDWEEEILRRAFAIFLYELVLAAVDVGVWLESIVDQRVTLDEVLQEARDIVSEI